MTSILGLKGQRSVSFHLHFAHLTIPFSFSFSFFHTVPVRCPLVTFRLSLLLHHLPIPLPPLATLPSPFFSPSSLLYLLTLPLFCTYLPFPSSPHFALSLSSLVIPPSLFPLLQAASLSPPLPTYSFAYKFPLRINFFVPLTRVHLMSWLSYL